MEVDPILLSVMLHYLDSTVKEMTTTLEHSARTSLISLVRDFSCSLYDSETNLVWLEEGLPVHTLSCRENLKNVAKIWGEEIYDGDIIMNNDPYLGNSHIGDMALALPIFCKGKLEFWAMVLAHLPDCGSPVRCPVNPSSRSIWEDGLKVPAIKIFEKGKERKDAMRMYLHNVRYPDLLHGDLHAMMGTTIIGKRRLTRLVNEYGLDVVRFYIKGMIDYADRRTGEEIRNWPEGTYVGESWVDSDGAGTWDIKVRCKVTIKGDMITIDWSESDPQVPGLNSSWAATQANSTTPILCLIDPNIPHNEGCLRHIKVIAPEGTVTNPKWPASTSVATVKPGDQLIEAVWKALAHAIPEKCSGGWGRAPGDQWSGVDKRGEIPIPYTVVPFFASPGGGATKGADGWPIIHTACSLGAMRTESVEIHELTYPDILETREAITDPGGFGQWNGGPAVKRTLRLLPGHKAMAGQVESGFENPCAGIFGGHHGSGGCQYLLDLRTGKKTFIRGTGMFHFDDKVSWTYIAGSGGGWGSPLDRSIEKVRDDARDELISVNTARKIYGVVLDPETYEVNYEVTERLRKELKAKEKKKITTPNSPAVAKYVEKMLSPGDEIVYLEPKPKWAR